MPLGRSTWTRSRSCDRPGLDPYAVLQVARHAEPEVVQAAYRALARRVHPDRSDDPTAQVRMAELNRAWEILGDPIRRAEYDRTHLDGSGPTGHGSTPTRPIWRRGPDGEGGAGPPPGKPSGTVLDFGRHVGWSMGEVARVDPGYLEWLEHHPRGQRHREEIDRTLRKTGHRFDREPTSGAPRRRR